LRDAAAQLFSFQPHLERLLFVLQSREFVLPILFFFAQSPLAISFFFPLLFFYEPVPQVIGKPNREAGSREHNKNQPQLHIWFLRCFTGSGVELRA
jgi:hypothetical protein